MKKSRITTLSELEAAQAQIRRDISKSRKNLSADFQYAKAFYKPTTLVNSVVGDVFPMFDWRAIALGVVRSIRKKL